MKLSSPLYEVNGVGPSLNAKFNDLEIFTVEDLLTNYPRKYQDYSVVRKINDIKPGSVTIMAKISQVKSRYARKGFHLTEAVVNDSTGSINLIWFNQPYRERSLKNGAEYYISGEYGLHNQRFSIINPSIELVSDFQVNTARILPIYREVKGLNSFQIRKVIKQTLICLKDIKESLPDWLITEYKLLPIIKAIEIIHFPQNNDELVLARHRIGFEELFDLSLAALMSKKELSTYDAVAVPFDLNLAKEFVDKLPFKLTDEQRITIWQIINDISLKEPMNRLLEGDVGTGKTVVASMVSSLVVKSGYRVALMAPTEILAIQHFKTIKQIFDDIGLGDRVGLLVGSMKKSIKDQLVEDINNQKLDFLIGTHSLIQKGINIDKLALVIIDEQHRFGVKQRQALINKSKIMPHLLTMTATPIPRSLQLTLFGDLDISIIKHKPYSDLPILTKIISLNQRSEIYKDLRVKIDLGEQIFVVCPTISDSMVLNVRSVEAVYKELSTGVYSKYRVGILHGKLSPDQRNTVLKDFVENKINVLVATTIIEVGVNIPNATTIVIESPDRFGLAQIHQLRGRVGRDSKQGYCYLMLNENKPPTRRLIALENTYDGFELAELDLKIRGPGVIYGTMQHGKLGFDLQVATFTDVKLIVEARKAATEFINKDENLLQYVQLNERVNRLRSITTLN
jgi:ATP-dependent DNA helicase RecG